MGCRSLYQALYAFLVSNEIIPGKADSSFPSPLDPAAGPDDRIDRILAELPPAVAVNWTDGVLSAFGSGWPTQYKIHGMVLRNILRTGPGAVFVDLKFTDYRDYDGTVEEMVCSILHGMIEGLSKTDRSRARDLLTAADVPDYASLRGLLPPVYFATGHAHDPQMIWDRVAVSCTIPADPDENDILQSVQGLFNIDDTLPRYPIDPSQLFRTVPTGWRTEEPGYALYVEPPPKSDGRDKQSPPMERDTQESENAFAALIEKLGLTSAGPETPKAEIAAETENRAPYSWTPAAAMVKGQVDKKPVYKTLVPHLDRAMMRRMILKWPYSVSEENVHLLGDDAVRKSCAGFASPLPVQMWIVAKEIYRLAIGSLVRDESVFEPLQPCPYTLQIDASIFFNDEAGAPFSGNFEADLSWLPKHTGGKAVFYGADISAIEDKILSPVNGQIAGIFYHALAYENLRWLGTRFIHRDKVWAVATRYITIFLVALFAAYVFSAREMPPSRRLRKPYCRAPDISSQRKERRKRTRPRSASVSTRATRASELTESDVAHQSGSNRKGKAPDGEPISSYIEKLPVMLRFPLVNIEIGGIVFVCACLAYAVFDLAPVDFLGFAVGYAVFQAADKYVVMAVDKLSPG